MGENISPGRRGRRTALAAAAVAGLAVVAGLIAGRRELEERWLLWRLRSADPAVRQGAIERLGARGRAGVLGTILGEEARAFPARLRDATEVAGAMFKDREWVEAEPKVLAEGWIPLGTRELEYYTRHLFVLPKTTVVAPGGYRHQVHCAVHVDQGRPRPVPSPGPGRVENVEVRLVAEFSRRYEEVDAEPPYPPGTVADLALDCREVRQATSVFPVLQKVELYCSALGYLSEWNPPYRIFVWIELEAEAGKRIAGKSFQFGMAMDSSGGNPSARLEGFGGSEYWQGDPQQVEANRAKYGASAR